MDEINSPEGDVEIQDDEKTPSLQAIEDRLLELSAAKADKLAQLAAIQGISDAVRERARYILLNSPLTPLLLAEGAENRRSELDQRASDVVDGIGTLEAEIDAVRQAVLAHIAGFETRGQAARGIADLTYMNPYEDNADVTQLIGTMEYERLCRARACELAKEAYDREGVVLEEKITYQARWVLDPS